MPADDSGMPDLSMIRRYAPDLTDEELLALPAALAGTPRDIADTSTAHCATPTASPLQPAAPSCGVLLEGHRRTPLTVRAVLNYTSTRSAPVAQGIEHGSPKAGVACSNHAGGTCFRSSAVRACPLISQPDSWSVPGRWANDTKWRSLAPDGLSRAASRRTADVVKVGREEPCIVIERRRSRLMAK